MVVTGILSLAVSSFSLWLSPSVSTIICCSLVVFIAVILLLPKKFMLYRFLPIIVVVLTVGLRCACETELKTKIGLLPDKIEVEGTVTEVDHYDGSVAYTVNSSSINGEKLSARLRLSGVNGFQLEAGDKVKVLAQKHDSVIHSADFDITAYISKLYEKEAPSRFLSIIYSVREGMAGVLLDGLSYDEAALLLAVTVGDKSYMTESVSDDIRRSGISHMAVVSGMHLAIMTNAFQKVAKRFSVGVKRTGMIGILTVLLIMLITGLTPSVMRAGLVYIIIFLGMLICRRPDPLNSLFTAVTLILIVDPFIVKDISFQLSCAATFGVLVLSPMMYDGLKRHFSGRMLKNMLSVVCVSLSATIMTLPFTVWHFGTLSTVSLVTNMVVTYPVTVMMMLAFVSILFSSVPFLYKPFFLLAGLCARFTLFVTEQLSVLPFAEIAFASPIVPALVTALFAVGVSVYCFIRYDNKKLRSDNVGGCA